MANIQLDKLVKRFGKQVAVSELSLEVKEREFVALLGPSGCGKTTTMNMISGLLKPDAGTVSFDGKVMNNVPPGRRGVGFMFQNYAVFTFLSVYDNIAFGLRIRRMPQEQVDEEVREVARLLQIRHLLSMPASNLSINDMQKVALARSMVVKPQIFLLDEPLSTLDAEFREEARTMIKQIHMEIGSTTIYVTHDQMEAMAIADRIVTMNFGEIQQAETPENIYHNPTNMFVANFIGSPGMNFVDCSLEGKNTLKLGFDGKTLKVSDTIANKIHSSVGKEGNLVMGVRPEDFSLSTKEHEYGFAMEVTIVEELGPENIINLRSGDKTMKVLADPHVRPKSGETVWAVPDQERIRIFDKETQQEIL